MKQYKMKNGGSVMDDDAYKIFKSGALGEQKNPSTGKSTYPESKKSEKTVQRNKPEVKKTKSGGKVRGYGMARGGKVCKSS
tara:strand:+ start:9718 stop:9960 length:243 start_codon:yes stop_codon:yes gene_type:complete